MELKTLTSDEVLQVYQTILQNLSDPTDPIAPAGLRSMSLLESAVSRQSTALGQTFKYPDPVSNAATLAYGICMNHPFHNGNKRCALVTMLVHLDRNKMTLFGPSQSEIYDVMLRVAKGEMSSVARRDRVIGRATPDEEVAALTGWIVTYAKRLARGERQVTYRQLRGILRHQGYDLGAVGGNCVDVVRRDTQVVFFVKRDVWTRVGTVGYHDEGTFVPFKELKRIRSLCKLREEDGVDTTSFYDMGEAVDGFINQHRTVLRRLAKT